MKVKCSNCKYTWETNSKLIYVTCPSCRLKVKNSDKNDVNQDGGEK